MLVQVVEYISISSVSPPVPRVPDLDIVPLTLTHLTRNGTYKREERVISMQSQRILHSDPDPLNPPHPPPSTYPQDS